MLAWPAEQQPHSPDANQKKGNAESAKLMLIGLPILTITGICFIGRSGQGCIFLCSVSRLCGVHNKANQQKWQKRRGRDLNSRKAKPSTVFETAPSDRSGTSPGKFLLDHKWQLCKCFSNALQIRRILVAYGQTICLIVKRQMV